MEPPQRTKELPAMIDINMMELQREDSKIGRYLSVSFTAARKAIKIVARLCWKTGLADKLQAAQYSFETGEKRFRPGFVWLGRGAGETKCSQFQPPQKEQPPLLHLCSIIFVIRHQLPFNALPTSTYRVTFPRSTTALVLHLNSDVWGTRDSGPDSDTLARGLEKA